MNEIEKQIEEMAKILLKASCVGIECENCAFVKSVKEAEETCVCLKALYNAGYRNCKDKVVLSKEEYDDLQGADEAFAKQYMANCILSAENKKLKKERNDYKQRYESLDKKFNQLVVSSCEALAKKSKVVRTKEEYNKLKNLEKYHITCEDVNEYVSAARKETAREIIEMLVPPCEVCDENWHKGCLCLKAKIAEKIAKQYGVEVEE